MFGKQETNPIPVYMINGFLESGKSSFYIYTIGQPYFQTEGKTLLILCEDGEVEYSDKLLKETNTDLERIEDEKDFTPAMLTELANKHKPERILIEWNGMWNYKNMTLPAGMSMEQQITCIDASTFGMYYSNLAMRSLLFEELKNSELVMFNRCDDVDEDTLVKYKRNVKAICPQADLVFEDKEGEIDLTTEEDLPFDVNAPVIDLTKGMDYGIWYLDAMEHPDRYEGKKVKFVGMCAIPDDLPKDIYVPGRMCMTCCAQDMQFIGYPCRYDKKDELKERNWYEVTATVASEPFQGYDGGEGIVLHGESAEPVKEPEDAVVNFAGPQ
ncbi:MAG: GTP-binding protein [Firmicutes bacterium]|nr:GTP-binding protein [Bacillota bacterium]